MKQYIERPFEVKSIADNGTFTGYGSVFGEMDSYRDIVVKGAFNESLQKDFAEKNRKVPMLWQHRSGEPIGIYTDIKEDDHGLVLTGEINMKVQRGVEAHALMRQGALSGLSIGYETIGEEYDKEAIARKLTKVKLWEVSPVTFPAGDSARIQSVKSIEGLMSISECEDFLRDAGGFSRKEAKAFIARVKGTSETLRDAVDDKVAASIKAAMKELKSISV